MDANRKFIGEEKDLIKLRESIYKSIQDGMVHMHPDDLNKLIITIKDHFLVFVFGLQTSEQSL